MFFGRGTRTAELINEGIPEKLVHPGRYSSGRPQGWTSTARKHRWIAIGALPGYNSIRWVVYLDLGI